MTLHLVGKSLNRETSNWSGIFAAAWPFVLLGFFALIGSSVAKWELGVSDTYITFAAYLLLFPFYVAAVPSGYPRLRVWVRAVVAIWVLFAGAALVGEIARIGTSETIHEVEYVVIGGFVAMYYAAKAPALKFIAFACLILAALLNLKLTGYLIALLAVMHIAIGIGWRRLLPKWRGAYTTAALIAVLTLGVVLALLYFEYRQFLPSGNTEVRLAQYRVAWSRFLQSPIWGSAYTDGSGELYTEYLRALNIPTHSDLLDLLKHGGLIALGLFIWGYLKIFQLLNRALAVCRDDRLLTAYFIAMRFFQVTALLTFAINPLLLRGPYLIVIWGNLGLACGAAIATLAQQNRVEQ